MTGCQELVATWRSSMRYRSSRRYRLMSQSGSVLGLWIYSCRGSLHRAMPTHERATHLLKPLELSGDDGCDFGPAEKLL